MKLSKKVLAAMSASALLLTAGIFTSCGEEDDDPEGAITGSNNKYTLSYTNSSTTDTYRCYNSTTAKHRGAMAVITLNKDGTSGSGAAMGFIWDLHTTDASASAEEVAREVSSSPRSLCIVAFANNNGTFKPYVSRFTNVYDLQAKNFGTDGVTVNGAEQKAVEKEYIGWTSTSEKDTSPLTADANGNYVMTVNVYPEFNTENETTTYTGGYVVDIYNGALTKAEVESGEKTADLTTTISAEDLGYEAGSKPTQQTNAVYANVYTSSSASGTWQYLDTYSAAEAVEE
nr:hypothetical protein [Treponema sp.]